MGAGGAAQTSLARNHELNPSRSSRDQISVSARVRDLHVYVDTGEILSCEDRLVNSLRKPALCGQARRRRA